ncbi:transcriptional regulator with XRE-family HTH domain [Thermomonospora umbrina]|uniref:Transcriptional regulator with XRE-family HTH domain n=2 Tax=Thermomonospora umbrina TaxID=111806 RepID=A0A3D9SZF3_9ACTN|nr:transcriptional regulator with XRE-family HTH domain [Thermomonospora umbrina]
MAAGRRARLARRRRKLGFSQESLAEALHADRSTIARWERGQCDPQPYHLERLCELLQVTYDELDELLNTEQNPRPPGMDEDGPFESPSFLWRPAGLNGDMTPDDEERLALAVARPLRTDPTVVESLAAILAAQRRLDDVVGPAAILAATAAQAETVTRLLRESRGRVREALAPVAGEWVQFHGWLHAEMGSVAPAVRLLTDAEELADDAGDGTLAAQAANFKGYLARRQGRPRAIVRHFLTAYNTPGAHPAQRLGDAIQAAQGYALLGEAVTARRLLDEASALADEAARALPPDTAYWLTPDFHHLNFGLALSALGEHVAAAERLTIGLESLPPDQQGAEWTMEYRDARVRAQDLSS